MSAALIILLCSEGYLLTHNSPDYSRINGKERHKGFPVIKNKCGILFGKIATPAIV
jgi:hypothetical protein